MAIQQYVWNDSNASAVSDGISNVWWRAEFTVSGERYRDYSTKFIPSKIKPVGILIIDNSNCFLPTRLWVPNSHSCPQAQWAYLGEAVQ
jgi:hypothetical protein